jgi:pimeloyl-ACP methyl ester carboxylesterase
MTDFLTVDNTRFEIRWLRQGKKNRPVLVFLHEGLGCVDMWKSFPEHLASQTGCDGFVFSRQGYGRSDPCPLPWKINFMHVQALKVLPKILGAAGIQDHMLIGHSDGGSIALIHAGSRHASFRLKGVITESAHVFCEPVTLSSIRAARQAYETDRLKEKLARYHGENTDNAFWGWNSAWLNPGFVHWDIQKYLPHIRVPLLALQGEEDPYGTPAQLAAIRKHVPDSITRIIRHCCHTPHQEQPEKVTASMAAFIQNRVEA